MREKIARLFGKELLYPEAANPHEIGRSLVISPHPDDDVLGMGGTIPLLENRVSIAYVTDGSLGLPGKSRAEAVHIRTQEALEAAAVLGIGRERLVFMGFEDQKTDDRSAISHALAGLLAKLSPEEIFIPSPIDAHPDHRNVCGALSLALAKYKARCWLYEVWTPLLANRLVDISGTVDLKRRAIRAHASQVAEIDYEEKILGLNAFRSMTARGSRVAEAFYLCTTQEYRRLCAATLD
jgi:LmbE family N-acetylglucosaminyl deacetylase